MIYSDDKTNLRTSISVLVNKYFYTVAVEANLMITRSILHNTSNWQLAAKPCSWQLDMVTTTQCVNSAHK